jgi:hypothetical protein
MPWDSKWGEPAAVGYKRPPSHSRFKPGQSGNPSGRRRAQKGGADCLREELSQTRIITENGREKRVSTQQLLYKILIASALKGNMRAVTQLFKLIEECGLARSMDLATRQMIVTFVSPAPELGKPTGKKAL